MPTLQVHLFRKVSIQHNGQPLGDLPSKALELLCYLLLHAERAHTREALAEILWPEAAVTLSQKYLRQTLWQLQSTLDQQAAHHHSAGEPLLLINAGWLCANPAAACWTDVQVFEQAYTRCLDLAGQALSAAQAQALEEAVALYQGDLLETWYQDWCIHERERLQLTYLAMLDKLMGYCEAQGYYDRGITYGQRILRYDPAREVTYQHLMRLYYRSGNRTTALREYKRCATALAREFGVQPAVQTVALYKQIQADCLNAVAPSISTVQGNHAATASAPGLDITKALTQLQTTIATFQAHIQQEMATIAHLLKDQEKTHQQTTHKTG